MTKRRLGGCVGECLQRRIRHELVWLNHPTDNSAIRKNSQHAKHQTNDDDACWC